MRFQRDNEKGIMVKNSYSFIEAKEGYNAFCEMRLQYLLMLATLIGVNRKKY